MTPGKAQMEHVRTYRGIKILRVKGDFTTDTTPDLRKICHKVSQGGQTREILLDFEQAGNIDTSAFACMINFIKENMDSGTRIGIINLGRKERELMSILKLQDFINTYETEEIAVSELLSEDAERSGSS